MRLAHSWRSQEQNVLAMGHKAHGGQLTDLRLVEGRLEAKIKLIQAFHEGEACQPRLHEHITFEAGAHLRFQQPLQELYIGPLFLGGYFSELIQAFWHPTEFQAL